MYANGNAPLWIMGHVVDDYNDENGGDDDDDDESSIYILVMPTLEDSIQGMKGRSVPH